MGTNHKLKILRLINKVNWAYYVASSCSVFFEACLIPTSAGKFCILKLSPVKIDRKTDDFFHRFISPNTGSNFSPIPSRLVSIYPHLSVFKGSAPFDPVNHSYKSLFMQKKRFLQREFLKLLVGYKDSVEITGYARRSWISLRQVKSKPSFKCSINFKIGRSYINRIFIPWSLTVTLFKRRFIHMFSPSKGDLRNLVQQVYRLEPADCYKGGGIRLRSIGVSIKVPFSR